MPARRDQKRSATPTAPLRLPLRFVGFAQIRNATLQPLRLRCSARNAAQLRDAKNASGFRFAFPALASLDSATRQPPTRRRTRRDPNKDAPRFSAPCVGELKHARRQLAAGPGGHPPRP